MSYLDIANSGLTYTLVSVALLVMLGLCVVFYVKTRKRALELGISKEVLNRVNRSTILFTIVPSLTIVVGLFAMSAMIGTAWSWFRLSVVGSVSYELMAAQTTVASLDITDTAAADGSVFVAVMFVMSIGALVGPTLSAILTKPVTQNLQKAGSQNNGFSPIMNACFMLAIMSVIIPIRVSTGGLVGLMVILTAVLLSMLIDKIASKGVAWLGQFNMPICLLVGMLSSLVWAKILG